MAWGSHSSKHRAVARFYRRRMSIHVTLRYDDARAAIAYLTGTLGSTEQHLSSTEDGGVGHAERSFGDDILMIGSRRSVPGATPDPFDTGRAVVHLALDAPDAVDAHNARAVAAGADAVQDLVDQPYGSREYAVRDPEGNAWSLGSYRPQVTP